MASFKERWKIKSNWQVFVILLVFAITGSSAAYLFTDKDTRTCVRKSVPRVKHTGRVRSTTSKALDSYIVSKK
jgi:hypothetical protein